MTSRATSRGWSSASWAPWRRRHPDLFAKKAATSPGSCVGYAIEKAVRDGGIDLARLLVGSRGTLALVTEATLRTSPIPAAQAVVLFGFARIGDAAAVVPDCLAAGPSTCDLFDWRSISLARDAAPAFREWIAEAAEAVLIVEFEGDEPAEVAERARRLSDRIGRRETARLRPGRGLAGASTANGCWGCVARSSRSCSG